MTDNIERAELDQVGLDEALSLELEGNAALDEAVLTDKGNLSVDADLPEDAEMDETDLLDEDADAAEDDSAQGQEQLGDDELPSDRVADLVEYVICGLVDDINAVSLDVTDGEGSTLIEVNCAEGDTGKVIGRKGRTIKAIRTLARALGQRVGTSVDVEVLG